MDEETLIQISNAFNLPTLKLKERILLGEDLYYIISDMVGIPREHVKQLCHVYMYSYRRNHALR